MRFGSSARVKFVSTVISRGPGKSGAGRPGKWQQLLFRVHLKGHSMAAKEKTKRRAVPVPVLKYHQKPELCSKSVTRAGAITGG